MLNYSTKYAYDSIKLLYKTILGKERLYCEKVIMANDKLSMLFKVDGENQILFLDAADLDYAQSIFKDTNKVFELADYGKLFVTYSKVVLSNFLPILYKLNRYRIEDATVIESYKEFVSTNYDSLIKLQNAFETNWPGFISKVGIAEDKLPALFYKPNQLFSMANFDNLVKDKNVSAYDINISRTLEVILYTTYLTTLGVVLNATSTMYNPTDIFISDAPVTKLEAIIKKVANSTLDNDTKVKFFTLVISFYKLLDYTMTFSGVKINDPIVGFLYELGKYVTETMETAEDYQYIDTEFMDYGDTHFNFLQFTKVPDVVEEFVTMQNTNIGTDRNIPFIIASELAIFLVGETDSEFSTINPIINYVDKIDIEKHVKNTLYLDKMYDNIMTFADGVYDNDKLFTVDPFTVYRLIAAVSVLRRIRYTETFYTKLSTLDKNKIIANITLTDGLIYSLYNLWFNEGRFYKMVKRPKYNNGMVVSCLEDLETEILSMFHMYAGYTKTMSEIGWVNSTDIAGKVVAFTKTEREAFLRRAIINSAYDNGLGAKGTIDYYRSVIANEIISTIANMDEFISLVRSGKYSLVYERVLSKAKPILDLFQTYNPKPNEVLSETYMNLIATISKNDKTSDAYSESVFDFMTTYESIADRLDQNDFTNAEFLSLTYIPLFVILYKNFNNENAGTYIEYKKPEVNMKMVNFENILNVRVFSPLRSAVAKDLI